MFDHSLEARMFHADCAIPRLAVISSAARNRAESIDSGKRGKPYAYVLSPNQWDRPTAIEMLERLAAAGIEVRRSRAAFEAGGKSYPRGSYVLPAAQPFRAYLVDLLEPQAYPSLGVGSNGRPKNVSSATIRFKRTPPSRGF